MSAPATPGLDRAANVTGALVLAVSDRMATAVAGAAGHAGHAGRPGAETAGVALCALHHFLDGPSIDRLRQVLGLTSSGAVRLVDRLEGAGLVAREPGDDGRTTRVSLTPAGRRAAANAATARAEVLREALDVLSADERIVFEALASRIAVGLMREPGATRWMCRLCDTGLCGVKTRACPVSRAAHERYAGR